MVGEMKVKDYLDLGMEFVKGDLCKDGNKAMLGKYWYQYLGQDEWMDSWYEGSIREFAWRKNTGEKPSYKGKIEVKNTSGDTERGRVCSNYAWGPFSNIEEWRPVIMESAEQELSERAELASDESNLVPLDESLPVREALEKMQKEAKSIYSKEMQEAGGLPMIGMKVKYKSGEGELALGADKAGICIVIEDGKYKRVAIDGIEPIQTEQEKLIDEAIELVRWDDIHSLSDCELGIIKRMIELGYKKP